MPKKSYLLRIALHWLLPLVGCCLLGWAALYFVRGRITLGEYDISCSGGTLATRRGQLASLFAHYAESDGLNVQLVESVGSEETLKMVDSGAIDVGFVSGGFMPSNHPNVRQLATIGTESLHLLVKSNLLGRSPGDLGVLRNRRVNVGLPGTGTYALSTELLEFCGLVAKDAQGHGDYIQTHISSDELISLARAIQTSPPDRAAELVAQLPDAIFWINPLPSQVVKELVEATEYDLIPLPFCESFRINGQRFHDHQSHRIDRRQVTATVIPVSTYRAIDSVPKSDCVTLGVPLIVVGRAGLSNAETSRLVAALYEGRFATDMPPVDLVAKGSVFPQHPVVTSYLRGRKAVAVRDFVDAMQNLLSVFGAFSAGVLAVFGFYRRHRTKSASAYASEIGRIERMSWGQTSPSDDIRAMEKRENIDELEEELVSLKQRIIGDYAVGQFRGEAAFTNLMTLISDTRLSLKQSNRLPQEVPGLRAIPRPASPVIGSRPTSSRYGT